jgi:hypothetical protein
VNPRQNIDLLVLLIQKILQLLHLCLQRPDTVLERLCISTREGSTTQLIAGLALESHARALRTAWADAIAADLLTSATIAGLGNTTLGAVSDFDHLHGEYSRHDGAMEVYVYLRENEYSMGIKYRYK